MQLSPLYQQEPRDGATLLDLIARHRHCTKMALPEVIPTLRAMATGNLTRVDNVFISDSLLDSVVKCNTRPADAPPRTDHFPIELDLDVTARRATGEPRRNYSKVAWEDCNRAPGARLQRLPPSQEILTRQELEEKAKTLEATIEEAVGETIPMQRPCPHSKRWWTPD